MFKSYLSQLSEPNEQQKDVYLKTRNILSLLDEENTCVVRLKSSYQNLKKEIAKKQHLIEAKRQFQAHKSNIVCESAEDNTTKIKLHAELQESCRQKQLQLSSVKQQFLANASTLNAVCKQNQSLNIQLQSKQKQLSKIKNQNSEKRKKINQIKSQIKGKTTQLKQQKLRTLALKQQLAKTQLSSTLISKTMLNQQISRQEQLSRYMMKVIKEMYDL